MSEAAASEAHLPEVKHVYQHHHFDSTRWNWFSPRHDDIIIATSYKAGTTWMQGIIANLIFKGDLPDVPVGALSPWLDFRVVPLEVVLGGLEAQTHRRFIKTHLPLDGIPFDPSLKYIYVSRDARDVFMSLWNHYTGHTEELFAYMNAIPGRVGEEFPHPPEDIHEFWKNWIARGWFDWETDGYPHWSHFYNVQSWWDFRDLPNILFVHYTDLLNDLEGEMRRIADYLGIGLDEDAWSRVVSACTFAEMKKHGQTYVPAGGDPWKDGANTFFHKGTNNRWREVLSETELAQYNAAADRALTPDCRRWLEGGRHA